MKAKLLLPKFAYATICIFLLLSFVNNHVIKTQGGLKYVFEHDSSTCNFNQFEKYRNRNSVLPGEVPNENISTAIRNSYFSLIAVEDSLIYFQHDNFVYVKNIYSAYYEQIGRLNNILNLYFLNNSPDSLLFFNPGKDSFFLLNPKTLQQTPLQKGRLGLLSSFSKVFKQPNQNIFYYTNNHFTYRLNAKLEKLDSFKTLYENFSNVDIFKNRIIASGGKGIIISDTTGKILHNFSLSNNNNLIFRLNAIRFNPVNLNEIFYCQNSAGIYRYNLKTKKNTKIIDSCPKRNFDNFFISIDGKTILADAENITIEYPSKENLKTIYLINLSSSSSILKLKSIL